MANLIGGGSTPSPLPWWKKIFYATKSEPIYKGGLAGASIRTYDNQKVVPIWIGKNGATFYNLTNAEIEKKQGTNQVTSGLNNALPTFSKDQTTPNPKNSILPYVIGGGVLLAVLIIKK